MDILRKIAERKIREAMERGEFDHLPLHGQPILPEDLSALPESLRMGYKILKNAGVLPPEMQLKKDMVTLQNLIDACLDEEERAALRAQMNAKVLRFNIMMEKRRQTSAPQPYRTLILQRLGGMPRPSR
jgi:Domain of unknown function (DUF1992)